MFLRNTGGEIMTSVPQAVQEVNAAATAVDCRPYQLAQAEIDRCKAKGDQACGFFWSKVWIRLMAEEYGTDAR